jgi:mRNA (guanine-N7-)-methyltransferase
MIDQAKNIRYFHNDVKFRILNKVCTLLNNTNITLLDIGVGRGGDMMKWHKNKIQKVIGIDISKSAVLEAIQRLKKQNHLSNRDYKFYFTKENSIFQDFLNGINVSTTNTFDIITSMFSFHYFWKSKDILCNIIHQISDSLKPGGYFVGTCPDGDFIHDDLLKNNIIRNDAILIERKFIKNEKDIGNKINFLMTGTLYFGENMLSEEYLVYKDIFIALCEHNNLVLIEYQRFSEYHDHKFLLSSNHKYASFLNTTFIFQKQ